MTKRQYSFEIDSYWEMEATSPELDFVLENPLSIADWWAAVFMRVEVIEGDYYSGEGMLVKLWTKGFLPHTFSFLANVTHDDENDQVIVKTRGDFGGVGKITRSARSEGMMIHVNWQTSVDNHYLYWVMMAVKPVFVANHKWAMRKGKEGLAAELLRRKHGTPHTHERRQKPTFPHNIFAK